MPCSSRTKACRYSQELNLFCLRVDFDALKHLSLSRAYRGVDCNRAWIDRWDLLWKHILKEASAISMITAQKKSVGLCMTFKKKLRKDVARKWPVSISNVTTSMAQSSRRSCQEFQMWPWSTSLSIVQPWSRSPIQLFDVVITENLFGIPYLTNQASFQEH